MTVNQLKTNDKFDNLSVKTYLSFNTATPTVDLCMDIGHIELHWRVAGSHLSTASRKLQPSWPPTAYKGPPKTATPKGEYYNVFARFLLWINERNMALISQTLRNIPNPWRWTFIGGKVLHVRVEKSKHSTVFSVFKPSLPPATINFLSTITAPNCNLLLLMAAKDLQALSRNENASIDVAPRKYVANYFGWKN